MDKTGKPAGALPWLFMRMSGLVLVVLAIGRLLIVHVVSGVEIIDYHWVALRWPRPLADLRSRLALAGDDPRLERDADRDDDYMLARLAHGGPERTGGGRSDLPGSVRW